MLLKYLSNITFNLKSTFLQISPSIILPFLTLPSWFVDYKFPTNDWKCRSNSTYLPYGRSVIHLAGTCMFSALRESIQLCSRKTPDRSFFGSKYRIVRARNQWFFLIQFSNQSVSRIWKIFNFSNLSQDFCTCDEHFIVDITKYVSNTTSRMNILFQDTIHFFFFDISLDFSYQKGFIATPVSSVAYLLVFHATR